MHFFKIILPYNIIDFKINSSHFKNPKTESTYNLSCIKIVIKIPIIISFCAALHQSDLHAYNANSTLPRHHAQAVDLSRPHNLWSTPLYCKYLSNFILQHGDKLPRYLNGNRKNQDITISHWNKGGSHLQK